MSIGNDSVVLRLAIGHRGFPFLELGRGYIYVSMPEGLQVCPVGGMPSTEDGFIVGREVAVYFNLHDPATHAFVQENFGGKEMSGERIRIDTEETFIFAISSHMVKRI